MSSRKQDATKLAELATQLESQASNLNLAAQLFARYNEAINALEQRVIELEQANDDLERRHLSFTEGVAAINPKYRQD